jgi:hypothetical protein
MPIYKYIAQFILACFYDTIYKYNYMKKAKKDNEDEVKTDLKHDTMEFVDDEASENKSAIDNLEDEEEEITPEELNILNEDEADNQAYALNSAEVDREQDEDNLPEEDWTEDIPEINDDEEEEDEREKEYRR